MDEYKGNNDRSNDKHITTENVQGMQLRMLIKATIILQREMFLIISLFTHFYNILQK